MDIKEIENRNLKALELNLYKNIYEMILNLKVEAKNVELGDVIRLKYSGDEKEVLSIAKALKPWRKGPFELNSLFIDSEWQSFIKYNILQPHLNLKDKIVGDIGCNNGYYLFRMLEQKPKRVVGFDPCIRPYLQFLFLDKFIKSGIDFRLLGVSQLPDMKLKFDTLFCLGVIYHRGDPVAMLKELKSSLAPGGELFLDSIYLDMEGEFALTPKNSYAKMSNVYFIPTIKALQNWCERAKFREFEVLATNKTKSSEQRKTEWIEGESLGDFLDPNDSTKTIEGYPAPKRVYIRVEL
ncbi:tRNA 5-methoxyuridine(34)/uridine 5-oxyacetic acid(34) synthase CmoB [uncultured Campylobacter sp.]|uniref:tRNA 5-methoxyuridine(34)/uridine 5-oxyacetic acid(34) synthase CmoB n=1 Tax=uncultured Campylobacter sp. TaxID=218934 RepID=UPI002620A092|nr:tRNA 5-methoxyuridine(34)/uridine 5-oxyacetic acid(34) synthase CmoB [uncultured Campylobacter sp.]